MKALILRKDADAAVATAAALIDKGFQILCVENLSVAHALIRVDTIDLLVMDEKVEGQLTHAIALSSERRNPYVAAILLTDRPAEDTDDLYDLIPCLYGLVGAGTAPALLGKLAVSAVSTVNEVAARVAAQAAMDAQDAEVAPATRQDVHLPLILQDPVQSDDELDDDESYADVAIAGPAMVDIAAQAQDATLQSIESAIMAEVEALFRGYPLPDLAAMRSHLAARAV